MRLTVLLGRVPLCQGCVQDAYADGSQRLCPDFRAAYARQGKLCKGHGQDSCRSRCLLHDGQGLCRLFQQKGAYFVTRAEDNMAYEMIDSRPLNKGSGVYYSTPEVFLYIETCCVLRLRDRKSLSLPDQ